MGENTSKVLGIDPEMRYFIVNAIQQEWGPHGLVTITAKPPITALRTVKSNAEINILRCANIVTKK